MKHTLTLSSVAAFGLLVACAAQAQTIIYADDFDNDTLATNTGSGAVGGGAASTTLEGPSSWSDDGDATFDGVGGSGAGRSALLYSLNDFQSNGGFELTVHYSSDDLSDVGRNLFGFGLLENADTFSVASDSPFAEVAGVYSIGVNINAESLLNRGLNFANGSTVTALDESGTNQQFIAGSSIPVLIRITPDGVGGADWTYSINGVTEASNNIASFDFSKSFHFAAYGQDNDQTKIINSVSLVSVPEPGTFALLGGLLALTSVMLRRRR